MKLEEFLKRVEDERLKNMVHMVSSKEKELIEEYLVDGAKAFDNPFYEPNCRFVPLRKIKNQTEDICLRYVMEEIHNLCDVKNQTEKICLAAVSKDYSSFKYVDHKLLSIGE